MELVVELYGRGGFLGLLFSMALAAGLSKGCRRGINGLNNPGQESRPLWLHLHGIEHQ